MTNIFDKLRRHDMASNRKMTEEEVLAEQQKKAERMLADVHEKKAAIVAKKKAEEEKAAAEAKAKRIAAEARIAAEWKPIARMSGAYDFDEETGSFSDSMTTVEIRQNRKTGEVRSFII